MINIIGLICSNIVTMLSIYTAISYAGELCVLFHMILFAFGIVGIILASNKILDQINIWRIK